MDSFTYLPGLGHANSCAGYSSVHRPKPLRYVWHHCLPQVCGGKSDAANLVSLCDGCHYAVHTLLYALWLNEGIPGRVGTPAQRALALRGWQQAVVAGTQSRIPNEGSNSPTPQDVKSAKPQCTAIGCICLRYQPPVAPTMCRCGHDARRHDVKSAKPLERENGVGRSPVVHGEFWTASTHVHNVIDNTWPPGITYSSE